METESATHSATWDPRKVISYGQKQLEGQLALFLRNVLGNSSTNAFICNHLMLFQLQAYP